VTVNKKLFCGFIALTILLTFFSCSGCSDSQSGDRRENGYPGEAPVNPEVEAIDKIADNSILVKIDEIKNDLIYVTETGSKRQHCLKYGKADLEDKIIGTLSVGATFSVLPDQSLENVIIAINVDELSGRWYYDLHELRGFAFESKGGLSSLNSGDISYREWKLKNGKLYIYYVTVEMIAPQRNEFLVEEATIETLNAEQLVLKFNGNTYDCRRQKKEAVQIQMNL